MTKRPSFQFYPGDWMRDPALQSSSLAARGMLIQLLCAMHDNNPYGELSTDMSGIARLVGGSNQETQELLEELLSRKCLSFVFSDNSGQANFSGVFTVISRRMQRDETSRIQWARAKKAQRNKKNHEKNAQKNETKNAIFPSETPMSVQCPSNVRPMSALSSSSSSSSDKDKKKNKEKEDKEKEKSFPDDFSDWWNRYPNKQGKLRAREYYDQRRNSGSSADDLLAALRKYTEVKAIAGSVTFSNASTFLNPKPHGDSANIGDYLGGNGSGPMTCKTCWHINDPDQYCAIRHARVIPSGDACHGYTEIDDGIREV